MENTRVANGRLYINDEGFGVIEDLSGYIYVSPSQIRLHELRDGDVVGGSVRPPETHEKIWALVEITSLIRTAL